MSRAERRTVVVGAGPAGLATALRLADHGQPVLLLDSGPDAADLDEAATGPATQDRDHGLLGTTHLYGPGHMQRVRARGLGGTSQRWSVRAAPGGDPLVRLVRPVASDLAGAPALGVPAWPVELDELQPYLTDAARFFDVPAEADAPVAPASAGALPVDPAVFEPRRFVFARSATVLGRRVADVLRHPAIEVRRGWTLTRLETDGDRVAVLRFATDAGGEASVVCHGEVVLAAGAWETVRQLLWARACGELPADDHLGRGIMDHPHARFGVLRGGPPPTEAARFHDFHDHLGAPALGHYRLVDEVRRDRELLGAAFFLTGERAVVASPVVAAGTRLAASLRSGGVAMRDVADVVAHPVQAVHYALVRSRRIGRHDQMTGGWGDPATALHDVGAYTVEAMMEQRPSADNRIVLEDWRDRLGVPRMRVGWSWTARDRDSYLRTADLVADAVRDLDVGRFLDLGDLGMRDTPHLSTGAHQLGGTPMASDPDDGVVDEHLRHHALDNLHVVSCGVFPSGAGYANPTWLLVGLALRLADRLAGAAGAP